MSAPMAARGGASDDTLERLWASLLRALIVAIEQPENSNKPHTYWTVARQFLKDNGVVLPGDGRDQSRNDLLGKLRELEGKAHKIGVLIVKPEGEPD